MLLRTRRGRLDVSSQRRSGNVETDRHPEAAGWIAPPARRTRVARGGALLFRETPPACETAPTARATCLEVPIPERERLLPHRPPSASARPPAHRSAAGSGAPRPRCAGDPEPDGRCILRPEQRGGPDTYPPRATVRRSECAARTRSATRVEAPARATTDGGDEPARRCLGGGAPRAHPG